MKVSSTVTYTFSPADIKEILLNHMTEKGVKIGQVDVSFNAELKIDQYDSSSAVFKDITALQSRSNS